METVVSTDRSHSASPLKACIAHGTSSRRQTSGGPVQLTRIAGLMYSCIDVDLPDQRRHGRFVFQLTPHFLTAGRLLCCCSSAEWQPALKTTLCERRDPQRRDYKSSASVLPPLPPPWRMHLGCRPAKRTLALGLRFGRGSKSAAWLEDEGAVGRLAA